MPSFFHKIKFAWKYFVQGKHRLQPYRQEGDSFPPPDAQLMLFLEEMFTSHGVEAINTGSWVDVDDGRLIGRAARAGIDHHADGVVLQLDFIFITGDHEIIYECYAGMGQDEKAALIDGCKSFQESSFHVILTTLLDHPCDHVERGVWHINGTPRSVTFGALRLRGELPSELWVPIFAAIQQQFQTQLPLSPGLHWVRYFYAHIPGDNPIIEALLDGDPSEELMSKAATFPWPATNHFYSARLFFIIQDAASPLTHSA